MGGLDQSMEGRRSEGGGERGENKLFLRVAKPLCPIACSLELLPSCRERQFLRKKAEETDGSVGRCNVTLGL